MGLEAASAIYEMASSETSGGLDPSLPRLTCVTAPIPPRGWQLQCGRPRESPCQAAGSVSGPRTDETAEQQARCARPALARLSRPAWHRHEDGDTYVCDREGLTPAQSCTVLNSHRPMRRFSRLHGCLTRRAELSRSRESGLHCRTVRLEVYCSPAITVSAAARDGSLTKS